jgi:hypothetical protein
MIIGLAKWLIYHIPEQLLNEPERYTLAFCFAVIGADTVFLGSPASVLGQIPDAHLINLEVGLAMLLGGIIKLVGLSKRNVWLQRLGASLLIVGCFGLIIGIWLYGVKSDLPVAVVYGMFMITYSLRLLSSTAERIKLYRRPDDCG